MPGETVVVQLRIIGRVQGVGYRAWCVHRARRLGLRGWVRNLTDGSVEAIVAGELAAVDSLTTAAHAGPPSARVIEVRRTDLAPDADAALSEGFHEAPTAPPGLS